MRRLPRTVVLAAGLTVALTGPPAAADPPATGGQRDQEVKLQDYNACGVNALYLIARMRGSDTPYQEVARLVQPREDGFCTMSDLVRAGRALGFHPVAVELKPEHWHLLNGHLSITRTGEGDGGTDQHGNHFLVFVGTRPQTDGREVVYLINPPESPLGETKERFARVATNHFVVLCRTSTEAAALADQVERLDSPAMSYRLASAGLLLVTAVVTWWPFISATLRRPDPSPVDPGRRTVGSFGRRLLRRLPRLAVLALAVGACGCGASRDGPQIEFATTTIDIGAVPGDGGVFAISFRNTGARPLTIDSYATSYACNLVSAPERVEPGQAGEMRFRLTEASPGRGSGKFVLQTNAPGSPHVVWLTWFGLHPPRLVPPVLDLSDLAPGEAFSRNVQLVYAGGDKNSLCRFLSATADLPGLTVALVDDNPSAKMHHRVAANQIAVAGEMTLEVAGRAPAQSRQGTCRIAVAQVGTRYDLTLPVSLAIADRLTAVPTELTVLEPPDTDWTRFRRTVLLRVRGSDTPRVTRHPAFLRCDIAPSSSPTAGGLVRTYHLTMATTTVPLELPFRGEVVVELPGGESRTIPLAIGVLGLKTH